MKVALISATKASLDPIERAFHEEAPDIELIHLLDTELLSMMEKEGSLTPNIILRFSSLLNIAVSSEIDAIQLTCSAFNNITSILQPLYKVKLFRSDEAMLDQALAYERIGLISTVRETPIALTSYLQEKKANVQVQSIVDSGLIHLLYQGKKDKHDERVKEMIYQMEGKVDVIVLSQYSMEHIADQVTCSTPILTAPRAAAKRCYTYLQNQYSTNKSS
ncbi:hypothetical protein ACIQ4Z_14655 [Peribacillus asahii]|uniref:hypothetical protein n=1 Tax=Peribacillus asahii TaxID=228899 RepID=UPI00382B9CAD